MKVLILNAILYTAETDVIPKVESIKDTMIYGLCMGFLKNGDEPVLIAADQYKPLSKEEYPFQIVWLPCGLVKLCKPRCLPLLKGLGKYLKKNKQEFDYIISSEVFSLLSLCAAVYAKEKLIIWHELGAHNNMLKKLPSKFWYYVIAKRMFCGIPVIPRSLTAKNFIKQYCNQTLDVIVDHGVDLNKIPYSIEKENYFVVVSQLIERKHIDGIIRCFAAFREEGNEAYHLKIIGDGVLREYLEQLVKNLGEESSIVFTGKLEHDRLAPILAKAKALLVNTSKDNSMVSIVESIAAGTPVLTTGIPFNSTYILSYQLGIAKDNWNQDDLTEICRYNDFYIHNCIAYRSKLSNEYCAEQFNQLGIVK